MESFISPKARKGLESKIHKKGLFSIDFIKKDEVVAIKKGEILSSKFLKDNNIGGGVGLQVSDDTYIAPSSKEDFEKNMIYINYSCDPNIGMLGESTVVAFRDIKPNEELTIDYAMIANDDISMECSCESLNCRRIITGKDWMKPELQEKYKGYFTRNY